MTKYIGVHRAAVVRPVRTGGLLVALMSTLALVLAVAVWSTPTTVAAQATCTGALGLLVLTTVGTYRKGLQ